MAKTICLLLLFFSLQHCRCRNQDNKTGPTSGNESGSLSGAAQKRSDSSFLNGITVTTNGRPVISSAYLTNEAGSLVSPQNLVQPGEAVYLNLVIEKGWVAENGRIAPGASQIITTDKGEKVSETGDLFADTPDLPVAEGKQLQLKTIITKSRPDIRYFIVRFRLWDKKGNGEVQGTYRLSLAGEDRR
jgi:hypothetical protein